MEASWAARMNEPQALFYCLLKSLCFCGSRSFHNESKDANQTRSYFSRSSAASRSFAS